MSQIQAASTQWGCLTKMSLLHINEANSKWMRLQDDDEAASQRFGCITIMRLSQKNEAASQSLLKTLRLSQNHIAASQYKDCLTTIRYSQHLGYFLAMRLPHSFEDFLKLMLNGYFYVMRIHTGSKSWPILIRYMSKNDYPYKYWYRLKCKYPYKSLIVILIHSIGIGLIILQSTRRIFNGVALFTLSCMGQTNT